MKPDKSKHACTLILAADRQNSVLQSHRIVVPEFAAYTPYGYRHLLRERSISLGFSGCLTESMTGWILLGNGYRAYSTALMRFFSPDNWSPFGKGGFNTYGYCSGDPVNRVDWSGHVSFMNLFSSPRRDSVSHQSMKSIGQYIPDTKYTFQERGKYISEGVASSWSADKRGWTLNVELHGLMVGGVIRGHDRASGLLYTPAHLAKNLMKERDIYAAQRVKLLMCYGADGGTNSFAAQLARDLGRPVKAYNGLVWTTDLLNSPREMFEQFGVTKYAPGKNYRSASFESGGRLRRRKHTIIDLGD